MSAPKHVLACSAVVTLVLGAGCGGNPTAVEPAAIVDGREIPRESVDAAVAVLQDDVVEGISPDERKDHVDALVRDVLGTYVTAEVVRSAAEREGIEVGDEEIADARERLVSLLGGEDQIAAALAPNRLTPDMFDEVIIVQEAYLSGLRELVPGDEELTEFVVEAFGESEITVAEDFGSWDSGLREIVP
jgi:hypothetical protein